MPTAPLMQIPKSRSSEEFEYLCKDVLTDFYGIRFTLYGRNGQKQCGIDMYGEIEKDKYIVAQCKNYYSPNSANKLIELIKVDIEATKQLNFYIDKFIAMTSADKDKNIQDTIMTFGIDLWFWEDIQEIICNNTSLLCKYYPQFYFNLQIDIGALNNIFSNLNNLKSCAQDFRNISTIHRPAHHKEYDIELYNKCVTMVNAALQISNLRDQWYLQIQKLNVIDTIEEILNTIPTFYDASYDYTGTTMIYTITSYLNFFSSDNNTMKFIKNCDTVINKFKEYTFGK